MQVRTAAHPNVDVPIVPSVVEVVPAADETTAPRPARRRRTEASSAAASGRRGDRDRTRAAERPVALTRSEEYRFIRADLHRLLITASLLGALMIALLFVLEL